MHRSFRPAALLFALALFVLVLNLPTPAGLTEPAKKTIAIFLVAITLWISHALPLMITSLLVIILFPLADVLSTKQSYALFGNEAIFFILGAFILASGVMRSGLSTRLAVLTLRHFGKSANFLILSLLCLSAFLSLWMSEHAVAAMTFPIVLEVTDSLKLAPRQSNYGKSLFLAMTWGCIIGGIATFLGGARAPLAVGILNENTGMSLGFLHWALAALPTALCLLPAAYLVIIRLFPPEISDISKARAALERKQTNIGCITAKEKGIGTLMIFTIIAWILFGESMGLANISIAAVVAGFLFKLLDWKEVEEDVNWGIFLMYGGAISLGYSMEMTGAAHWLAEASLGAFVDSGPVLLVSIVLISFFLTEAISNTAVVALMLPLAISLAADFQIHPKSITLALTIPAGLAFQLPMGTPATAIAYSSGFVGLRDTIFAGFLLKFIAIVVFLLSVWFYWPILGLF